MSCGMSGSYGGWCTPEVHMVMSLNNDRYYGDDTTDTWSLDLTHQIAKESKVPSIDYMFRSRDILLVWYLGQMI